MENFIDLDILIVDYSKVLRIQSKIEEFKTKLSFSFLKKEKVEIKILEKKHDLYFEIENSPKIKKKFKVAILMGNLAYTHKNFNEHKLIYDENGFSIFPNSLSIINSDKFITDIYSKASLVLIDENGKISTIKNFYDNLVINFEKDNCIFICNNQKEIIKKKIAHLLKNLCRENIRLTNDNKVQFGFYMERLNSIFNSIKFLYTYDISKYFLLDLNILSFQDLISKSIFKLFNGEILKDFEKIIISKLTNNQILEILNIHIQSSYKDIKLSNYIDNIKDINKIIGISNFKQYIELKQSEFKIQDDNQNNIIEVDFIKKKIKR